MCTESPCIHDAPKAADVEDAYIFCLEAAFSILSALSCLHYRQGIEIWTSYLKCSTTLPSDEEVCLNSLGAVGPSVAALGLMNICQCMITKQTCDHPCAAVTLRTTT